ncbi:hypothetical protein [Roseivirga sp.]|uniref:hypothetical protein n=1 Tax=Roseivirga sp. TaxID=1964215 RepID=UPI003B528A95
MHNQILRHLIASIKYRFNKAVEGSPMDFGNFGLGHGSRSPREIVHHMYDVIHSTRVFVEEGAMPKGDLEKLSFEKEVDRFKAELYVLDLLIAQKPLDMNYSNRLIQGPLTDVLTHIGQLAMLQRLVGNPLEWEDFSKSDV